MKPGEDEHPQLGTVQPRSPSTHALTRCPDGPKMPLWCLAIPVPKIFKRGQSPPWSNSKAPSVWIVGKRRSWSGSSSPTPRSPPTTRWTRFAGWPRRPDLIVAGSMLQKRHQVDIATYIGSGKVEELKELVQAHEADLVVFDNDLGPAQTRNLEKLLGVKVIDRTEVILDIFATRAQRTKPTSRSSWPSSNTPCRG